MELGFIRSLKSKHLIRVIQQIFKVKSSSNLLFSYSESEFSQNINSDGYGQYFSKLKQSLNQLKQHDRCFVPEYFDCDDLAMVRSVMKMRKTLREICENETADE